MSSLREAINVLIIKERNSASAKLELLAATAVAFIVAVADIASIVWKLS